MSGKIEDLETAIERAEGVGQLLDSAATNIRTLLAGAPSDLYMRVVGELVAADAWRELIGKRKNSEESGKTRKDS